MRTTQDGDDQQRVGRVLLPGIRNKIDNYNSKNYKRPGCELDQRIPYPYPRPNVAFGGATATVVTLG